MISIIVRESKRPSQHGSPTAHHTLVYLYIAVAYESSQSHSPLYLSLSLSVYTLYSATMISYIGILHMHTEYGRKKLPSCTPQNDYNLILYDSADYLTLCCVYTYNIQYDILVYIIYCSDCKLHTTGVLFVQINML